jgi:CBS domain containing-hemolysin-like protein
VQSESSTHLLEENERKIIDSIFRFSSTSVKEIMVPRVDIVGVEVSCSITEAKAIIVDSGYSRIPVYKKTIDEIIGMIYAKDLILYPEKSSLMALQRKVSFIPQNMKIQTLLTQFQSRKKQIAIVVDEYGGTSGLVTLEDILEELVGEIMDEYDEEQPMVTRINDATHLISGMIQVAELNRQFDLNLDEDFDNLADFLFSELNHIPHRNERFLYKDQVEFVISHIKKQRIGYVRMRIIKQKEES